MVFYESTLKGTSVSVGAIVQKSIIALARCRFLKMMAGSCHNFLKTCSSSESGTRDALGIFQPSGDGYTID